MKRIIALFTMLSAAVLAQAADRRTLPDWTSLPPQLTGHTLTFVTADGVHLNGKLLKNGPTAFSVDISSTVDVTRFPKGKRTIPYDTISEIHGSIRGFSFRQFADTAFIGPLENAVHANGLFTLFFSIFAENGDPTPIAAKIIDTLSIPFWLGWAAGGLAITPAVAPIGFLRGSEHYDFRVQ
jgi:hypothetical protein